MSKWISCLVTASKIVLVEVEDDDPSPEDTAMLIAGNEAFPDGGLDEVMLSTVWLAGEELERALRHADKTIHM